MRLLQDRLSHLDKSEKCRKQLDISQEQNFQDKLTCFKRFTVLISIHWFKPVFLKLWAATQFWAAEGLYLGREAFNRNREETLHFQFFFF